MTNHKQSAIRYTTSVILFIVALNAFGGGYYGMAGAAEIPTQWLSGSPFKNYFLPALFLLVVVGGSALLAALLVFIKHRKARTAAFCSSIIMLLWISVQVAIIGYVSWMQPAIFIVAVIVLLLASRLSWQEH